MNYLIFLTLFGAISQSFGTKGKDPIICQNLAGFACSSGVYDDGTGFQKAGYDAAPNFSELQEKYRKMSEELFYKKLNNSDEEFDLFRLTALAATNQEFSPRCPNSTKAIRESKNGDGEIINLKECFKMVANDLSYYLNADLFYLDTEEIHISEKMGALEGINKSPELTNLIALQNQRQYLEIKDYIEGAIANDKYEKSKMEEIKGPIFKKIKSSFIDVLETKIHDPDTLEKLKAKVNGIKWSNLRCHEEKSRGESIYEAFAPHAYYNSENNLINMCDGLLLGSTSEFPAVMAIAHELAHSIDPCNIEKGSTLTKVSFKRGVSYEEAERSYILPDLIGCLRSENSIKAEVRALTNAPRGSYNSEFKSQLKDVNHKNWIPVDLSSSEGPTQVVKEIPFNGFCSDDQIGESVSDWFGVETLAHYADTHFKHLTPTQKRYGFANAVKPLCFRRPGIKEFKDLIYPPQWDEHSEVKKRIDAILSSNPKIRKQMECQEPNQKYIYCKGNESQIIETPPLNKNPEESAR